MYGHQGWKEGRDELGDWDWHKDTTVYKLTADSDAAVKLKDARSLVEKLWPP